jgi:hypothetical protein
VNPPLQAIEKVNGAVWLRDRAGAEFLIHFQLDIPRADRPRPICMAVSAERIAQAIQGRWMAHRRGLPLMCRSR